ncbi:hypothetical protein E4U57_007122, partial [Claviceps arundinis]
MHIAFIIDTVYPLLSLFTLLRAHHATRERYAISWQMNTAVSSNFLKAIDNILADEATSASASDPPPIRLRPSFP